MTELSILNLKPEYQKVVLENQKKYNSDFNSTLSDKEIGVLLQDIDAETKEELVQQGLKVEKTSKARDIEAEKRVAQAQKKVKDMENAQRVETLNKKITKIKKQIAEDKKRMAILESDYKNGTANGINIWDFKGIEDNIRKGAACVGGVAGFAATCYAMEDLAIIFGLGFVGGGLAAVALAGVTMGGMALYNHIQKKNPNSEMSIRYQSELPQLIKEQQAKIDKENAELNKLLAELK